MKKLFLIISMGLLVTGISAQDSGIGLGVIIGEPTGISAKIWTAETTAIDAGAAWSLTDNGALHLHADFLMHKFDLFNISEGKLPFYFGVGARIRLANDPQIGVRIPVGLDYMFDGAPIDIFFEIVPILDLLPATDFDINGAIGARYFF